LSEAPPSDRVTVHMIGNAHIDPVWLWRWTEGREEVLRTCREVCRRLAETPGYIFTHSAAVNYLWIEEDDPALFAKIQGYVRAGRWEIVNGWWVEPDCNIPEGESFVRQGLLGKRYFRDRFGVEVRVGYNLDTFGHANMLPQILSKSGYDYYVFFRPNSQEMNLPQLFWWEAPDGSRVLACRPPFMYAFGRADADLEQRISSAAAQTVPGLQDVMCFYGHGDHGGGPTQPQLATIRRLGRRPSGPRPVFGRTDAFFRAVEKKAEFPVVPRELQYHSRGCYTAVSQIKRDNRTTEMALLGAERWAALAHREIGLAYPQADLNAAWQKVLFNQFHDTMGGTCLPAAYSDSALDYAVARDIASRATDAALARLAEQIDTTGPGHAVVIFNPHPWPLRWPVTARVRLNPADHELVINAAKEKRPVRAIAVGPDGPASAQYLRAFHDGGDAWASFLLLADLPPLGHAVYHVSLEKGQAKRARELSVSGAALENFHLRLTLSQGLLRGIELKHPRAQLLAGPSALLVLDDPSDTWSHDVASFRDVLGRFKAGRVEVVEAGPVRARVRIRSAWGKSSIVQEIALYVGLPWAECALHVDWHEQLKMLKLALPTTVADPAATYESPFGSVARPANGEEQPGLKWADISGRVGARRAGLGIINDSKYGYDALAGELRLSVLRSPIFSFHRPRGTEPGIEYSYTDQGEQTVRYLLVPHAGGWRQGDLPRRGWAFNLPPIAREAGVHPGRLPAKHSWLSVKEPNVVLSALKKAEDSEALVVRLYETAGRDTDLTLSGALLGKPRAIPLSHNEIKTLRLTGRSLRELDLLERPLRLRQGFRLRGRRSSASADEVGGGQVRRR
jgi:alpha-mannosidase